MTFIPFSPTSHLPKIILFVLFFLLHLVCLAQRPKLIYEGQLIQHGDTLTFESNLDNCQHASIEVSNVFNSQILAISKVFVSGQSFYLLNETPHLIAEAPARIDFIHYPSSSESSVEFIEMWTNDHENSRIRIYLKSMKTEIGESLCDESIDKLVSSARFNSQNGQISLSNNLLKENTPFDTLGTFDLQGSANPSEYNLISGVGDRDNSLFSITQSGHLVFLFSVDFESVTTLTIRVRATGDVSPPVEQVFIIEISNVNESSSSLLQKNLSRLGYDLTDVALPVENTIIAVGSNQVLRSTDFGLHWLVKNLDGLELFEYLVDIEMVDEQTGFLIGNSGTFFKTTNGGIDWEKQDPITEEYPFPRQIFFLNTQVGYAIGDEGTIYRTEDSGLTWDSRGTSTNNYENVHFFNDTAGFVIDRHELLKTVDGGLSWDEIDLESNRFFFLKEIQFPSVSIGYIVSHNGIVFKSIDGGISWLEIAAIPNGDVTDMKFIDERVGYIIRDGYPNYKTQDGGVTWEGLESIPSDNYYGQKISFNPGQNKAVIVGDGQLMILFEDDAWSKRSKLAGDNFNSVEVIGSDTFLLFGQENYKTVNKGISWTEMSINEEVTDSYFLDRNHIYAMSRSELYLSTDQGESWVDLGVEDAINQPNFRYVHFTDSLNGFVHNGRLSLYRTLNGGLSWSEIKFQPNSFSINDVTFLDSNRGYLIGLGSGGTEVYVTSDGGASWSLTDIIQDMSLFRAYADSEKIILAGRDGDMVISYDQGQTWITSDSKIGKYLNSLAFVSPTVGYAVSGDRGALTNGELYQTRDAGVTWNRVPRNNIILRGMNDVTSRFGTTLFVGNEGEIFQIDEADSIYAPIEILGKNLVSTNSTQEYFLLSEVDFDYSWEVEGQHSIVEYNDNHLVVQWLEEGNFKVTATAFYNGFRISTDSINGLVLKVPDPLINGNDTVFANSQGEVYSTTLVENNHYVWRVVGQSDFTLMENSITVDWSDNPTGEIQVVETSPALGVKGINRLVVRIVEPEVISAFQTSVSSQNIYPNPTDGYLHYDFNFSLGETIQLRLTDSTGRVILEVEEKYSRDASIDLRSVKNGLYYLQLSNGIKTVTQKVLVR